jgi:hypothetical protein
MTLAELKKLSAGYPKKFSNSYASLTIPVLDDALKLLRDSNGSVLIMDLKV